MNSLAENYIKYICTLWPRLEQKYADSLEWWKPEPVPLTIIFGDFGVVLAEDIQKMDGCQKERIFSFIEYGMHIGEQKFIEALATGLIEALIERTKNLNYPVEEIIKLLGPSSRDYAVEWVNWTPRIS